MPAVQTSYSLTQRAALAGMKGDMTPEVILSRIVESTPGLGFGVVAVKGTGDRQVKPAAAGAPYVGITLMDPTIAHLTPQTNPDFYPDKDVCAVMQKGTIWVVAGADVTAMDPVYFVPATGVFTNVATNNTAIPGASFDTSATTGALVMLRLK